MEQPLRKLNEEGVRRFRNFIQDGAAGPAPLELLANPETSTPLPKKILISKTRFSDRYQFGQYMNQLFNPLEPTLISHDQGFWSALAIVWFDLVCPLNNSGNRKPDKEYRYVLSPDYRHYYRHLVRSPWQLVRDHGKNAEFLLISPREQKHPLCVHGEILEQLGGRQQVLASKQIINAASMMYFDPKIGKPKRGAAGSGRGSARRFGLVLRQLDLTFDPECMPDGNLLAVLPREFDRWTATMLAPRNA